MTAAMTAPTSLRLSHASSSPRTNAAIEAVKQMPIEELRAELKKRRSMSTVAREQAQRELAAQRGAEAAERLRHLGH